jgi:hypothetical protein
MENNIVTHLRRMSSAWCRKATAYLNVLRVIAAIHRVEGQVSITPDGKGLMSAGAPVLSLAPNGGGLVLETEK